MNKENLFAFRHHCLQSRYYGIKSIIGILNLSKNSANKIIVVCLITTKPNSLICLKK